MSEAIRVETASVITEALRELAWGQLSLMDLVSRLVASGVYRYHADFVHSEITFYTTSGPSLALTVSEPDCGLADDSSLEQLQSAFQAAWRDEQAFNSLQETAMKAGCCGYFL